MSVHCDKWITHEEACYDGGTYGEDAETEEDSEDDEAETDEEGK